MLFLFICQSDYYMLFLFICQSDSICCSYLFVRVTVYVVLIYLSE